MTEIRTIVELRHPPERVWRALTDRELLPKWFASVEARPTSISRFEIRPIDLPELDELIIAELVELDPPCRMVLRWPEAGESTRVECELTPTSEGCRLTVTQADDLAPWQPADPDLREECHQRLLGIRLPAVLDWLAFQEVDLPAPTEIIEPVPAGLAGTRARSQRRLGVGLAVLVLALGAAVVVTGLARGRGDGTPTSAPATAGSAAPSSSPGTAAPTGPTPAAGVTPVQPSQSTRPSPRRPPTAAAPGNPAKPGRPRLAARYTTLDSRLLGYQGEVVVTNDGDGTATSWTVVITLVNGAQVGTVSGAASFRQEEERVTFTGTPLPAGRAATIRFEVERDATLTRKGPTSCAVGAQACAGL